MKSINNLPNIVDYFKEILNEKEKEYNELNKQYCKKFARKKKLWKRISFLDKEIKIIRETIEWLDYEYTTNYLLKYFKEKN